MKPWAQSSRLKELRSKGRTKQHCVPGGVSGQASIQELTWEWNMVASQVGRVASKTL